jgi:hypothetical protein
MAQFQKDVSTGGKSYYGTETLSNLQFKSRNVSQKFTNNGLVRESPNFLAYNFEYMPNGSFQDQLEIDAYIPENFTITEAYITFVHTPINWDNAGDYNVWGYCRKINAYTADNAENFYIGAAYNSEYYYDVSARYNVTKILNAFGVDGYTPSVPSASDYKTETTISANIKDSIKKGNQTFIIKSSLPIPTLTGNLATDGAAFGLISGYAGAILNIYGYQN